MLVLLGAFIFWLALNGRLAAYAAFATTASGSGFSFPSFSIPVSITGSLLGSSSPTSPTAGASTTGSNAGMPGIGQYQAGLPSSDTGVMGNLTQLGTGYYPSGLPGYGTLGGLTSDANTNIANGGPF